MPFGKLVLPLSEWHNSYQDGLSVTLYIAFFSTAVFPCLCALSVLHDIRASAVYSLLIAQSTGSEGCSGTGLKIQY